MKHVSIVIPRGHFSLVNVEGSLQILSWVNEFQREKGKPELFKVELVGLADQITQTNGLFTINTNVTIDQVKKTDLIIIPAIHGNWQKNLENNREFVPWMVEHYNSGAELVSLCIASFFLASTGLLDGKNCSTHWNFANEFRKLFPSAILQDEKIVTESKGIYTSGGAYSFTNLLIYLVEKHAGREAAVAASKAFMIDIDRNSQSPFMIFSGQKNHKDQEVLEVQEFIEQNYGEKITVDDLCNKAKMGRRSFERRFKKATCNTILEYIQRVKIEAAKKELENGQKTVNEIMFDVGYSDTKAFRKVFKKFSGMSPANYRVKYAKAGRGVAI